MSEAPKPAPPSLYGILDDGLAVTVGPWCGQPRAPHHCPEVDYRTIYEAQIRLMARRDREIREHVEGLRNKRG